MNVQASKQEKTVLEISQKIRETVGGGVGRKKEREKKCELCRCSSDPLRGHLLRPSVDDEITI